MGQVQSNEYKCNEDIATKDSSSSRGAKATSKSGPLSAQSNTTNSNVNKECSRASAGGATIYSANEQHVRKLSNVSNRNIQLLSMKPRSERDSYADNLWNRRRSSLINLILGAPSSGPRFCDDLCSLNSGLTEHNFGIEFFPEHPYNITNSVSSSRLASVEDVEKCAVDATKTSRGQPWNQKRRRSSLGSISTQNGDFPELAEPPNPQIPQPQQGSHAYASRAKLAPSIYAHQARQHFKSKPSVASTLTSIDLTSSFDKHDRSGRTISSHFYRPPLLKAKQTTVESLTQELSRDFRTRAAGGRVNQNGRILRRTGSELSLYSSKSSGSSGTQRRAEGSIGSYTGPPACEAGPKPIVSHIIRETKFIIMMQVCLPFILAGFGNMSAGLALNSLAEWKPFHHVPVFFILLPPFIGLKGNIEMTLASRLSTLANLNLLQTSYQMRRAYLSNLVLVLSQAIGLSIFAALISILCEVFLIGGNMQTANSSLIEVSFFIVIASSLATALILVLVSSLVIALAIGLARIVQVNPDNLSTLIAALYGDVTCVLTYGVVANWMYGLREQGNIFWPLFIIISALAIWPILLYAAYKFEETHGIVLSSVPPMLTSIMVSLGSGAVLSMVVGRFRLIALYQPVVNGFGANLIAVQASRVSTWLWCAALRKVSISAAGPKEEPKKIASSLASFTEAAPLPIEDEKPKQLHLMETVKDFFKTILWSFCNSSPNSIAARLLLVMLIPAHTIYFFVILLLSPASLVVITWQFYSIYIMLCLVQVFILLSICEPLMTLFMRNHLDPDIFGISLLMALADLTGTLCLTGAFYILAGLGDVNAAQ